MKDKHFGLYLYMVSALLLVIGGLNWGLVGAFNFNIVSFINQKTFNSPLFESTIYVIVGLAALYLMRKRNFYLPFLGESVMAPSLIVPEFVNPKATISVTVDAPNAESVMYWAAEPLAENVVDGQKFAYDAYDKYTNSGVSRVENGKAVLKVECPQSYYVNKWGSKKVLSKHLHYRIVYSTGFISEIKTVPIDC